MACERCESVQLPVLPRALWVVRTYHMICAMYRYSYPWWRFNQGDFVCLHPIPGMSIRKKKHLVVFYFLVLFESEGKTRKDQRHARDSESAVNTTASTPRFSRLVEDCPTIYVTCTCSLNTWLQNKMKICRRHDDVASFQAHSSYG